MLSGKQIDYILELAQTQNFNRAAERLFISQPSLSYQVKQVEEEVGFRIFNRSNRGVTLTPAGKQFCETLHAIRLKMQQAVEQGQNFAAGYDEDIIVGLPIRSALAYLPDAMRGFAKEHPAVKITPSFTDFGYSDAFLAGRQDLLFAMEHDVTHIPNTRRLPLFASGIYLIVDNDDPLAERPMVSAKDLKGRRLMVGGASPPPLVKVQDRLIRDHGLEHFNSSDHATTLINVAAGEGVCLAPGFLSGHTDEFTWIPFDCDERIFCVLCIHEDEERPSVRAFANTLICLYADNPNNYRF